MKKNKNLTMGLMTSFVGLMSLASCSGISAKENIVMTFKDYAGNEVAVYSDEIFEKYARTSTGVAKSYDAVLQTLIRYQYQNPKFSGHASGTADVKLAKTYETIHQEALDEVSAQKKTAEQNAKTNGTSYAEEWEKILKEKSVDDENGLKEYFIYQYEKEEMTNWYYKKFVKTPSGETTSLLQEYIGVKNDYTQIETDDVNSMYPYHMRHILVKTSGSKSNYSRDVITENEATNLSSAIKYLTSKNTDGSRKYTFGEVAHMSINEDTSKDNYGDLGIVSTGTSFVNEFKLGMYAFDAILSGVNQEDDNNDYIYDGLGLKGKLKNTTIAGTTVTEAINALNTSTTGIDKGILADVPVGAFLELGEVYNKVKDDTGHEVNENTDFFYPRNILWNEYLNIHHPFRIKKVDVDGAPTDRLNDLVGFNDAGYLTDEYGREIVCVRSEYGIHFMVMERSIFKNTNNKVDATKVNLGLEDYYNSDVDKAIADTKINYVTAIKKNDTTANYRTRANAVKDEVKSFDKTYDYRLYSTLLSDGSVTIKFNEAFSVESDIQNYIEMQKETNQQTADETLNNSWKTYLEMLTQEKNERKLYEAVKEGEEIKGYKGKVISDVCRLEFGSHSSDEWKKGGKCYYEK